MCIVEVMLIVCLRSIVMSESKRLEMEATRMLRSNGFTWAGRPKSDVDVEHENEKRRHPVILCGFRGSSRS